MDFAMTSPPYWGKREYENGGIGLEGDYRDYIANLAAIFLETSPRLILRCARETGASLEAIQRLYRGSILLTKHTCPELEESLVEAESRASSGF